MLVDINKITLRGDYILLKPVEIETKTKSGLFIPSNKSTHYKTGIVLKVSESVEKNIYKEGDTVYYLSSMVENISVPTESGFEDFVMALDKRDIHMVI